MDNKNLRKGRRKLKRIRYYKKVYAKYSKDPYRVLFFIGAIFVAVALCKIHSNTLAVLCAIALAILYAVHLYHIVKYGSTRSKTQ